MAGLCASAATLAILDWRQLRSFLPMALGASAFALGGSLARTRRGRGWRRAHLARQGGSCISMVTTVLGETSRVHRHSALDLLELPSRCQSAARTADGWREPLRGMGE
jgi:hypothetical protein